LYPLARNACLICLLVAIALKKILPTAASSATILRVFDRSKKLPILLLPVELTAKEEHALLSLPQPESSVSNASGFS